MNFSGADRARNKWSLPRRTINQDQSQSVEGFALDFTVSFLDGWPLFEIRINDLEISKYF